MGDRIDLAAIRARVEIAGATELRAMVAALCCEGERLRASNERLRHVVELDEAIYLDLARAAGFDHEPPSDARACIAAVKAMATERDALRAELNGALAAVSGFVADRAALRAELDDARNVALGAVEDCAGLREIIAGRDRAPTPEEVAAHAKHGRWRAVLPGGRIFAARYPGETERHWRGARWWAIDETETPCAWPVVTEVSRG